MSTGINNPERLPVEDEKLTLPAEPAGADGPAWLSNPTTGNIELVSLQYGSAEMASLRGLYYGGDFQLPKFDAPARVKDNITIAQDGKVTIDYPAAAGEPHKSRTLVPDGAGGFKEIDGPWVVTCIADVWNGASSSSSSRRKSAPSHRYCESRLCTRESALIRPSIAST